MSAAAATAARPSPRGRPPQKVVQPVQLSVAHRQQQQLFWANFCGWLAEDDCVVDLHNSSEIVPETMANQPFTWKHQRKALGFDRIPKKGLSQKQLLVFRQRVREKMDRIISDPHDQKAWQENFMVRAAVDGKWYRAHLVGPYAERDSVAQQQQQQQQKKKKQQQQQQQQQPALRGPSAGSKATTQEEYNLTVCFSEQVKAHDGVYTLFCRQIYDQLKAITQNALQNTWTNVLAAQICAGRSSSAGGGGGHGGSSSSASGAGGHGSGGSCGGSNGHGVKSAAAAAADTPSSSAKQVAACASSTSTASAPPAAAAACAEELVGAGAGGSLLAEEMVTIRATLHDPRVGILCALSHDMELPLHDQIAGVAVYRCHPHGKLPFVELVACAVSRCYTRSGVHAMLLKVLTRHARARGYKFLAARVASPLAAFPGLPNPDEAALLEQEFVRVDKHGLLRRDRTLLDSWATADAAMMRSDGGGGSGGGSSSTCGCGGGGGDDDDGGTIDTLDTNGSSSCCCGYHNNHGVLVCLL
jgi:uncharacterized membrane protein YgcG